jgi:hypothetical protein
LHLVNIDDAPALETASIHKLRRRIAFICQQFRCRRSSSQPELPARGVKWARSNEKVARPKFWCDRSRLQRPPSLGLRRQDLLPCAPALTLPHSLPPVLSVPKLDAWVICRHLTITSYYTFRNLSIFTSVLQTFDTVSYIFFADNYAAMGNIQWPYLILHKAWSVLIQHSQKWIGRFRLFIRTSNVESKSDREPLHTEGISNGKWTFALSKNFDSHEGQICKSHLLEIFGNNGIRQCQFDTQTWDRQNHK